MKNFLICWFLIILIAQSCGGGINIHISNGSIFTEILDILEENP